VERLAVTESRFDAHHTAAELTPLVGRDEEVDLLLRRWSQAQDGEGKWCCWAVSPASARAAS